MYPKNDLYEIYEAKVSDDGLSRRLPDISRRYTLDLMNRAINCCDHWGVFLDVGANRGHYSVPLLHKFEKGIAVEAEANDSLAAVGQKYGNLAVKIGLVQNVKFGDKIDFILLSDVFEHIPVGELNGFIKALADAQNTGGVIYLGTPNPIFCGPAEKSDIYFEKSRFGHCKHYTKEEVLELFHGFGYRPVLFGYEENRLRGRFKRLLYGFSRRDRRLADRSVVYAVVSAPLVGLLRLAFRAFGEAVRRDESKRSQTAADAMTQVFVLKKF